MTSEAPASEGPSRFKLWFPVVVLGALLVATLLEHARSSRSSLPIFARPPAVAAEQREDARPSRCR